MGQVIVKLTGGLAAAVAVEWTDTAAATDDTAGWWACTALGDGRWQLDGAGPGRLEAVRLRYRRVAGGPWSLSPRSSLNG